MKDGAQNKQSPLIEVNKMPFYCWWYFSLPSLSAYYGCADWHVILCASFHLDFSAM